ncbi:FAD-dependent oxidoreductase [Salinispira pacifica]|uniref:Thioredoxin reductase n=1 Tax=Salinispira pacifica TaxID=1307761 RepID=V5WIY5_9SPIO|nr:FAD-dependent oxidoreductase [Salinispira pacifica]AHC15802.1 Thioredoxin reductase [Salinispira pacifica]
MAGKITEIDADQYQAEVLDKPLAVLDFYSTECPPCEALASKYQALSEIYGDDINFVKIFRQGNRELATELDVTGSPTLLFYRNGEITGDKLTGGIKRSDIMRNLDALVGEKRAAQLHGKISQTSTDADVIVLGGGPAGLTAGLYLAQARLKTVLIDVALPGGYVATTHQVSNYPGFVEPQQGMMLSHYMSEQAKANGVEFRAAVEVNEVNLERKQVKIDGVETITGKKLVIATGSSPRPLGVPGEMEYRGDGISYCATCDAKYFDDKDVIVIGGGNSAIEEAMFISKFARSITIVHQFDDLQANKQAQEKIKADSKVSFMFSHEPREFKKYGTMDMGVVVEDLKSGEKKEIRAHGVFVFIGFVANLEGLEGLDLDQWGHIKTDDEMRTNLEGVYAAGDIISKMYRQITTAVSDGTIAAISISKEMSE